MGSGWAVLKIEWSRGGDRNARKGKGRKRLRHGGIPKCRGGIAGHKAWGTADRPDPHDRLFGRQRKGNEKDGQPAKRAPVRIGFRGFHGTGNKRLVYIRSKMGFARFLGFQF